MMIMINNNDNDNDDDDDNDNVDNNNDMVKYVVVTIMLLVREDLSTGYGLRFSTETYGSKREKTVFQEYLQEACFVLTDISKLSRNIREFTG